MNGRQINEQSPLLLGSASPRRRDILSNLGIPILVAPADIDESQIDGDTPTRFLSRIVEAKWTAVIERGHAAAASSVLVADTVVLLDDEILGKPADSADAARILGKLAGRTHEVRTRYAIGQPGAAQPTRAATVCSSVTLRAASDDQLQRYADSGEGLDKAGAYAIQGLGAFLVERIDGSYSNVVGLPACEVVRDLVALGLLEHFPLGAPL